MEAGKATLSPLQRCIFQSSKGHEHGEARLRKGRVKHVAITFALDDLLAHCGGPKQCPRSLATNLPVWPRGLAYSGWNHQCCVSHHSDHGWLHLDWNLRWPDAI